MKERIRAYIAHTLPETVRQCDTNEGTLLALPFPYTVPCAGEMFQELYYWDTYFTNVGLLCLGEIELARHNIDNMLWLVDTYGFMPNGNRTYYLNRSQPPFLSEMVRDLYEEHGLYTKYTENNCRRKKEMFAQYLPQTDGATKALVEEMMAELDEKSGQGFVWEDDVELAEDDTMVGGHCVAEKIIILSDTYCEYAGETFIQLCKKSPRVTVIGRPTMGNVDYCNPISVLYDEKFTFTYPISKTKAATEGKGVSGKGVAVDQYIPWTPMECSRDVILERAIAL